MGDRAYQPARIFLVGVGKAAEQMTAAACALLGTRLYQGILIHKRGRVLPPLPPSIHPYPADHPIPTQDNLHATQAVLDLLAHTTPDDLVLCLISGGTSALLTQPSLPLADWQALSQALLACGCSIQEFNRVRQFLDPIKGGGLAIAAAPAPCASLILSDVVGNPLDIIGSGPTVPVVKQAAVVRHILERYGVKDRLSLTTQQQLDQQLATIPDTRPDHVMPVAQFGYNHVVADGQRLATAAAEAARLAGFSTQILTTHLQGEAQTVGQVAAALAQDAAPGSCLLLAGETTVTLSTQAGRGGRNQEMALAAALALAGVEGVVVASWASDGEDGPTPAAGAWITGQTVLMAGQASLTAADYLARHDSYTFFQRLAESHSAAGSLIHTGPTGTNVNDLVIILRYSSEQTYL